MHIYTRSVNFCQSHREAMVATFGQRRQRSRLLGEDYRHHSGLILDSPHTNIHRIVDALVLYRKSCLAFDVFVLLSKLSNRPAVEFNFILHVVSATCLSFNQSLLKL